MTRPLQVLGFGALSVDTILYVDRPMRGGKGRVIQRVTDHGGNIGTALVAVAALGGQAGFIGWLNDGTLNDPSAAELQSHGVDIGASPRRPDAQAVQSTIIVGPDGERFIAFDDDVPHGTSETLPDAVLGAGKVLLIDSYATQSIPVIERARSLGLAVVADIEWSVGPQTDALIARTDHLVLPLAFAQSHCAASDPALMLTQLWSQDRAAVVLTDGENGVYLRQAEDTTLWHIPAHRVQAVDTTGAGDCFHGAYALALAEGKSPLASALYAATAAAISVTGRGGRASLPDHATCLQWMAHDTAPVPLAIGSS